jgi:hypothetical protein
MYLAVLDAARSPADLATYLHGELLADLWPDLHLTRAVRAPWEARFKELAPGRCDGRLTAITAAAARGSERGL